MTMNATELSKRLDRQLSLRFFTQPDPDRGCMKHWLARTASHYYTSDTCRLVGDSEDYPGNVENGEGWGDTPEEAVRDLARSMIERRKSKREASANHVRMMAGEIETLLGVT